MSEGFVAVGNKSRIIAMDLSLCQYGMNSRLPQCAQMLAQMLKERQKSTYSRFNRIRILPLLRHYSHLPQLLYHPAPISTTNFPAILGTKESDTPRKAGGLMSRAASKAVGRFTQMSR